MTRLWFVRHGPTHAKAFAGWRDIPADLSDAPALDRLNRHLPAGAQIVSSDLIRAKTTADVLTPGRTRLPDDAALREFHFGDWDGLTFDEVSSRWPDLSRRYWEEPGHIAPPGGESWLQGEARMTAATEALVTGHAGRDIIIVAHFGTILTQLARTTGLTPYEALAHQIDNLSVTCLCFAGGGWVADCINYRP